MQIARFKDIVALKTDTGKRVAFHAHNLQVAQIDEAAWSAISGSAQESSARDELEIWNRERDEAAKDFDIEPGVRSLLVNIAQICNLKCAYCAAGGDGTYGDPLRHVDLESVYGQIQKLLSDLRDGSTFSLTFFGGEPLLAPETIRALARFTKLQVAGRRIRLRFCIITNGTLVTEANADLLAELGCHVTVSLDGPPEINDRNRPSKNGAGSTEQTLRGLQNLQRVRERLGSITAGAVFGKHNTAVLETYKFLSTLGFDALKFDFAADCDDAAASAAYAAELARTADYAYAKGGEKELRRIGLFDGFFHALDNQRRLHNHCGAGKSHMTMDGRGRLAACQWFIGKPEDQLNPNASLSEERTAAYAKRLNELNNCQSCWARHLCGGGCLYVNEVKTGSKTKKDDAFCDRTRNTIAKAIEYYAEARYQGAL